MSNPAPAASAALFTPISAPVLRSVDPVEIARFVRERDRYEIEIESKKAEMPNLSPMPYIASIDRSLLRNLFFMGVFDILNPEATNVKDLTNDDIKSFIDSQLRHDSDDEADPSVINNALTDLRMPMHIADTDSRITQYCSDFFDRLDAVGYGSFRDNNPKQTINLLLTRLYPPKLKTEMKRRVQYNEGVKTDIKRFINILKEQAVGCQIYDGSTTPSPTPTPRPTNRTNPRRSSPPPSTKPDKDDHDQESEIPVCLWGPHKKRCLRHRLKDCKQCPKEEKDRLFEELRKNKQNPKASRVSNTADDDDDDKENSVMFSATFAEKVRITVCTDTCADDNLMDSRTLKALENQSVDMTVETLKSPRQFFMAATLPDGSPSTINFHKTVTLDVELHVRHGTAILLRNMRWLVTDQSMTDPLIGRPVLHALGLDARKILSAAADRLNGSFDVSQLVETNDQPTGTVARLIEGICHSQGGVDDHDLNDDDGWLDMGPVSKAQKAKFMDEKINAAITNGMSTEGAQSLRSLLCEFDDVVAVRLSSPTPADIAPMQITLKPNAVPVKAKPRRYSPEKRAFMDKYVQRLLELGFVEPATAPTWISAPLIVPKAPPANFRLTIDYRALNKLTVQTLWPMPNIEAELQDIRQNEATCFMSIDFCSGYWQALVDRDSRHLLAFMTTSGVVQPTRTPQGAVNSAANFQEKVPACFESLRDHLKAWLDDFLFYEKSEQLTLALLRAFLDICRQRRLVISLPKSDFFAKEAHWCGRIIDADGVRMNPKNIEGIINSHPPQTGAELCQYVNALNWMSTTIPRFAERIAPLRELLEKAYAASGKRTKRSIARLRLRDLGWDKRHDDAFHSLQTQLQEAVKLSHRNTAMTLCIHTDASEFFWAVAVTQCQPEQLTKPHLQQAHQPLAFLSGKFSTRETHWTTYEREAYAIVQAFKRLEYLLTCDSTTTIFTDHRNLLFVFNPLAIVPSLGRHTVLKVVRWALFLSSFQYRIEHVDGESNLWPDIMTRWLRGYRSVTKQARISRISSKMGFNGVPQSPLHDDFHWPNKEDLRLCQSQSPTKAPPKHTRTDGIIYIKNAVWIPDDDAAMKVRLLTIAHAGSAGHRGIQSTYQSLKSEFYWTNQFDDVRSFINACLLCNLSKGPDRVPRPLSITVHASRPNQVIHFDYLYLGASSAKCKYALVVKDDLSNYCWIEPTPAADAENAARILSKWIRVFSVPEFWISDQGSHFKNEVMEQMARTYNIRHRFSIAYSPWINGTVESMMRSILSATRCLIAEMKLAPSDWELVIPIINSALNETPTELLGKNNNNIDRCPLEVMTGILPSRAVMQVNPLSADSATIHMTRARAIMNIDCLQDCLFQMHKSTAEKATKRRIREIDAHNRNTNIVTPSFTLGDFVLVRRATRQGHKLLFKWSGPSRITAVYSKLVYGVTPILSDKEEKTHCTRLLLYRDQLLDTEVPDEVLDFVQRLNADYENVKELMDIKDFDGSFYFLTQWEGLPDQRDWTWQEAKDLHTDIPDIVESYLHNSKPKPKLRRQVRDFLKNF